MNNTFELMATIPGTSLRAVAFQVSPSGAQQFLVLDTATEDHYLISGVVAPYSGWEVLVFPADESGEVTDWLEVAGGRGMTFMEAAVDLERRLR